MHLHFYAVDSLLLFLTLYNHYTRSPGRHLKTGCKKKKKLILVKTHSLSLWPVHNRWQFCKELCCDPGWWYFLATVALLLVWRRLARHGQSEDLVVQSSQVETLLCSELAAVEWIPLSLSEVLQSHYTSSTTGWKNTPFQTAPKYSSGSPECTCKNTCLLLCGQLF